MLTDAGRADLAANSGAWTGTFVLRLATGAQVVDAAQTALADTYQFPAGTPYSIPLGAWQISRNADGDVIGIKATGVAPSDLAAVTPTRWGLFKGGVLYAIGEAPAQARKFSGVALVLDVSVPIAGTNITNFSPTSNITVQTINIDYASAVEINTGTETGKAVNPAGLAGSDYPKYRRLTQAQFNALTTEGRRGFLTGIPE